MASSEHPPQNIDVPMDEDNELDGTDDDVEISSPGTGNKGKRKQTAGVSGSGTKTRKKTRSWVWEHYSRHKYNYDKCNCHYCGKEMCYPTKSGTSNLKKHINFGCKSYESWKGAHKESNQTVLTPTSDAGNLGLGKVSELVCREAANEMLVLVELPLAFIESLEKYLNPFGDKVEMNKLLIVASVFDPRKKMKFAQLCFDELYGKGSHEAIHLYDSVELMLKRLFDEYNSLVNKTASGGSQGASSQSQRISSQSQEQVRGDIFVRTVLSNGIGYQRMDNLYEELVEETGTEDSTNELDLYLKESVEKPKLMKGSEYDVLSWWRKNSPKYPVLSLIARDILAMQVSSVASESAFSTSGRVLDPYRSCLTHYMIEALMCTEQWLKCEIHINEKGVITVEQMLADIELQDDLMREFELEFNLQGT